MIFFLKKFDFSLFTYAKVSEDLIKDIGIGGFAGDFSNAVQGAAQIAGCKFKVTVSKLRDALQQRSISFFQESFGTGIDGNFRDPGIFSFAIDCF